jgi:hypothetical protein
VDEDSGGGAEDEDSSGGGADEDSGGAELVSLACGGAELAVEAGPAPGVEGPSSCLRIIARAPRLGSLCSSHHEPWTTQRTATARVRRWKRRVANIFVVFERNFVDWEREKDGSARLDNGSRKSARRGKVMRRTSYPLADGELQAVASLPRT